MADGGVGRGNVIANPVGGDARQSWKPCRGTHGHPGCHQTKQSNVIGITGGVETGVHQDVGHVVHRTAVGGRSSAAASKHSNVAGIFPDSMNAIGGRDQKLIAQQCTGAVGGGSIGITNGYNPWLMPGCCGGDEGEEKETEKR
jgi:hypothetical protein